MEVDRQCQCSRSTGCDNDGGGGDDDDDVTSNTYNKRATYSTYRYTADTDSRV